jgi:FkbM family methyltransferase
MSFAQKSLNRVIGKLNSLQGKGWGSSTTKQEVFQILKKHPNPEVVIDVGGNKGDWTAAILEGCKPKAVYVLEPATSNQKILTDRFRDAKNVHIVPYALSDREGTAALYADSDGSGLASLHQRQLDHLNIPHEKIEEISTIRFETLLERYSVGKINILKLDIEGHEFMVLKAIDEASRNQIDLIQFEFGGCNIDSRTYFQDFWYLLHDHFVFYRITPLGLTLVPQYRELDEVFTTTNYVCVNRQIDGR